MTTATRKDIRDWLITGKRRGATHVIIACDTFAWANYPVYVMPGENIRDCIDQYNGRDLQRVIEVYNLAVDLDEQLAEHRAFHP